MSSLLCFVSCSVPADHWCRLRWTHAYGRGPVRAPSHHALCLRPRCPSPVSRRSPSHVSCAALRAVQKGVATRVSGLTASSFWTRLGTPRWMRSLWIEVSRVPWCGVAWHGESYPRACCPPPTLVALAAPPHPLLLHARVHAAYRIGQSRDVVTYRLVTCGTIEEMVYRRQVFKVRECNRVMGFVLLAIIRACVAVVVGA